MSIEDENNRENRAETDIRVSMIDIHTHILPGLDDGPRSWDETIELCYMAREDGTEVLVATPHIKNGIYSNRRDNIVEKVNDLREKIEGRIDLKIYWGADIHITTDLVDKIKTGEVPTINDKGYILLELPCELLPPQIENFLFELKLKKITPILTHVERSYWIRKEFERIYRFIEMGALVQVTAMSLTGGFGGEVKSLATELVRLRLAHLIASDSHSLQFRPPGLSSAFKVASSIIGEKDAHAMVKDTPEKIIMGREIDLLRP